MNKQKALELFNKIPSSKKDHLFISNFKESLSTLKKEPMYIFMGRGDNKLRGTIRPKTVINVNKNPDVNWTKSWRCPITAKIQYIYENTGENDKKKFNFARNMEKYIPILAKKVINDLSTKYIQEAIIVYLILNLSIRIGNENEENDVIGACSLKKTNLTFLKNNYIEFDFIGKDSIPFKYTYLKY